MTVSMPPLASTTPVTPPTVNMKMNPIAHSIGVSNRSDPPHMVAIHEKILMPVGTAITMVAAVKYIFTFTSSPTVRSEEHTSELQSLMRISYAVFCLKKKKHKIYISN